MQIVYPKLLYLLLLTFPLIWFISTALKRYKKRFSHFAQPRFWDYYFQNWSSFFLRLKAAIILIVFSLLVVALSRPQWDHEKQEIRKSGLDIAICIDISKSMDATDMSPSRLQRAKDQISAFIDEQKGDRIALIPFAGTAMVQCPLTDDYEAAKMLLSSLDTNTIPIWGTDIGKALQTAAEVFENNTKSRVLILISDGEDLGDEGIKAAHELSRKGIIIYTLGVGSPSGATVQISSNDNLDNDVPLKVNTKLDSKTLEKIAHIGNGQFYMVTPTQDEINAIMKSISSMVKSKQGSRDYNLFKEQFGLFVILALVFLLLETLITTTTKSANKKHSVSFPSSLIVSFIIVFLSFSHLSALNIPYWKVIQNSKGNFEYKKRLYKKAEKTFEKNVLNNPNDPILQYNHGNATYRQNKADASSKAWKQALSTKDNDLKSKIWHNLGNYHFEKKDYQAAMDAYRQAVLANPHNKPAQANYDLAKRMLLKQNQSQQQQKSGNEQKNNNQQKQNEKKEENQSQNEKKETVERILKALEQKEVNDRKRINSAPQRRQNKKWW